MINTGRSLAYFAAAAAVLSLASCSSPESGTASEASLAAQHRFNVYFDVAKSGLTPEAQQVIAQVAAEANRNASTKIVVVAPETDSKGHRANTVQAALIASGVSPERIDARWIGPQGSPPPGVRDPRNRVVEISFEPGNSAGSEPAKVFVSRQSGD
jgi:outer membrane protein OmpA-like peptidoglycan-associated protein